MLVFLPLHSSPCVVATDKTSERVSVNCAAKFQSEGKRRCNCGSDAVKKKESQGDDVQPKTTPAPQTLRKQEARFHFEFTHHPNATAVSFEPSALKYKKKKKGYTCIGCLEQARI